jgi:hypothetical protein
LSLPLDSRFIAPPKRWGIYDNQELSPQLLEPRRIGGGLAHSVLNVAVAEIVLNEPGVRAPIGKNKKSGMAQHVGMNGHRHHGTL